MSRFGIQLIIEHITWSTRYNLPKNDRYSVSTTDWTLVILIFTVWINGFNLIYNEIDTPHADMYFIYFTIAHTIYVEWIKQSILKFCLNQHLIKERLKC